MADDSVAQDQLRAFIERIERMEEEKAAIAADIKEIYSEAKGNGFDVKVLREIVRIRKQDHSERMEHEAIRDLYMDALGMSVAPRDPDDTPPRSRRSEPEHRSAPLNAASDSITFDADGVEIEQPETAHQAPMAVYGDSAEVATAPLSESVDILPGGIIAATLDGAEQRPAARNSQEPLASAPVVEADHRIETSHPAAVVEGESFGSAPALPTYFQPYDAPIALSSDVIQLRPPKPLRPHCLNPGSCAGQGRQHCWKCTQAAETTTGGAA